MHTLKKKALQGFAVKAGVQIARGQNILFMDADGATKISDVHKLEIELQRISQGSLTLNACLKELLPKDLCLKLPKSTLANFKISRSRCISQLVWI